MYQAFAQFQDILHVNRERTGKFEPQHTVFSFYSDFTYKPYIKVPGHPRLEPGMKVLAILREKDDWKTLVGWLDLETGDIAKPDPGWHQGRLAFSMVWLSLFLYIARGFLYPWSAGSIVALGMSAFGGWSVYSDWKYWRQTLREVSNLERLLTPPGHNRD